MTSNNDRFYTLANKVRLRREHFGGLVFDEVQKAAIDVDRPCMRLLELARTGISPSRTTDILVQEKLVKNHQPQQQVGKLVSKLLLQGLLVEAAVYEHENSEKKETLESRDWPDGPNISAPEKIEWAITYKCGQDCPDCYAKHNYLQRRQDLQTEKALELIRKIAQWGVFQLDIRR